MVFPTLNYEIKLWNEGYKLVCGLDEVGRGCFAGPVVAGAVVISSNVVLPDGVADSKLLNPFKRQILNDLIIKSVQSYSVGEVSVENIDKYGIDKATQMAFRKAIRHLKVTPDFYLIDAFFIKHLNRKRQLPVVHGDRLCSSISAASIIAKVYRDNLMENLHKQYPHYGFAKHKGYGTKQHREAIKKYGLCPLHRRSFNLSKFI